jgi:hypothetical protein
MSSRLPAIIANDIDEGPPRLYPNGMVMAVDIERNLDFFRHCSAIGLLPVRDSLAFGRERQHSGASFWTKRPVQATRARPAATVKVRAQSTKV